MVTTETLGKQISQLQSMGTQEPALFETVFDQLKIWEPTEGPDESFANEWMAWINDQALPILENHTSAFRAGLLALRILAAFTTNLPPSFRVPQDLAFSASVLDTWTPKITLHRALHPTQAGRFVAVKTIRMAPPVADPVQLEYEHPLWHRKELARHAREVVTLRWLRHPFIVEFVGTLNVSTGHPGLKFPRLTKMGCPALVMEWMAHSSLDKYLGMNSDRNPSPIMRNIAEALEFIHSVGIIHGDIKPMNILVSEHGEAKLADFDHTISVDHTEFDILGPATERWGAPETFLRAEDGHDHTITPLFQNDTWSFGCVWWEVYSGQRMYTHEDAMRLLNEVSLSVAIRTNELKPGFRPNHDDMTEGIWHMIQRCWDLIPTQRPSWGDILNVV